MTLREIMKYKTIKKVFILELNKEIVELCQEHFDEDDFDALDVSDATKFNDWTISSNVDNTWTSYPDDSITTDKDFEYFMYETRGMALNVESNNIASRIPYGVEYFENDLKTVINTSKTANFSTNFFTAITDLGVAVDNTQF